jgi:hypothetical protein
MVVGASAYLDSSDLHRWRLVGGCLLGQVMNQDKQLVVLQRWFGQGKTLTKLEAMRKFGVGNLGGRVYDLKQARWPVTKDWKTLRNGKRVAEYRFEIKR